MINPYTTEQQRIRAEWAELVYDRVNPDIYAVCTLKQGIMTNGFYVAGDKITYEEEAEIFMRNLSSRVYGKSAKRFNRRLPGAITLENKGGFQRFHLNMLLRKPAWMPHELFAQYFAEEWSKLLWSRPDVKYGERYADAVRYSFKEGSDSPIYFRH